MDQDYINDLSDDEKQWLSNFMEEYMSGNFQHKGKKLHRTKKEKKTCYDRNNSRNRDVYTLNRTRGWIEAPVDLAAAVDSTQHLTADGQENALIELIDLKKVQKP